MSHDSTRPASVPLEDYALLSDLRTAPLVSRDGSVDWLCFPSVDSAAVFSALLGEPDDGRWQLRIADGEVVSRRYRPGTFVLETQWRSPSGCATVVDALPTGDDRANLVREVTCTEGVVTVEHDLRIRPDYNRSSPWVHLRELPEGGSGIAAIAGPDMLVLRGPLLSAQEDDDSRHDLSAEGEVGRWLGGSFELQAGKTQAWVLTWCSSWSPLPEAVDASVALERTECYWRDWRDATCSQQTVSEGQERSLLVLRALTHGETGGIVAAPHRWAARGLRRGAQLGLPLHVAARRLADHRGGGGSRPHRGRPPLAGLAAARGRRRPGADPDHVRDRRAPQAARARAGASLGL